MSSPIIFHYNKAHNMDKSIPPWIIKYKGETYYIHHFTSNVGFTTKETPDNPHTKGSLKMKGTLELIEKDGETHAIIN